MSIENIQTPFAEQTDAGTIKFSVKLTQRLMTVFSQVAQMVFDLLGTQSLTSIFLTNNGNWHPSHRYTQCEGADLIPKLRSLYCRVP